LENKFIFVVGNNTLQNQLIASFLENRLGIKCLAVAEYNETLLQNDTADKQHIILYDCMGKNPIDCVKECTIDLDSDSLIVSLFNLDRNSDIEEEMLLRGIRGFFYKWDSLRHFEKGVSALLKGEYWISRKIMSDMISRNNRTEISLNTYSLSPREVEIISMIAECASNGEISDRLCISRHTVKTHLYNIFRKINVESRFQAALWAARHL